MDALRRRVLPRFEQLISIKVDSISNGPDGLNKFEEETFRGHLSLGEYIIMAKLFEECQLRQFYCGHVTS